MKLLSTLASTLLFAGTSSAVDFDFFDFEGWYEGAINSVAALPRPAGSRPTLNMLLECEEGDGFNGSNCEMVIRGPPGFSVCARANNPNSPPDSPGQGAVFKGMIAENQFDADKGIADFHINEVVCDGYPLLFIVPPNTPGFPPAGIPIEPTKVKLQMLPGASNRHVKSLKFDIANEMGDSDVSFFYKLGGGFKSS